MSEHADRQHLLNRLNFAQAMLNKAVAEQANARQRETLWRSEIEIINKALSAEKVTPS